MREIGFFSQKVIDTLNLNIKVGTPIKLSQTNINHMMIRHPTDYSSYGNDIRDIITNPDYVGIKPGDQSIEFVKEYKRNNDYVKVAVRISMQGVYYARSLYVLSQNKVTNFIKKGTLIKI